MTSGRPTRRPRWWSMRAKPRSSYGRWVRRWLASEMVSVPDCTAARSSRRVALFMRGAERILPEPLGVLRGAVEVRCRLEKLEFAIAGGDRGAIEERFNPRFVHRLEGSDGVEGLIEDLHVVDAGNENRDGLREAVGEGFDRLDGVAVE